MNRVPLVLATAAIALVPAATASAGQVRAGAAVVDGTYHVGNSAGQYASTRDGGYGNVDPHMQQVKNQASYGVQARESVRALVIKGADGNYIALVSDDHYIPQDALWRRTAQLLDEQTGGTINEENLTLSVTHNHSSPSYSSFDWGVWAFQDVFDFRFFDYYAHRNAEAVKRALDDMHDVRVSGTVSYFDKFHKNPMGPGIADDGGTSGFPRSYTDHDLTTVRFENVDDPGSPKPLATVVNIGQHPEDLEGYDLISGEYPTVAQRIVDRSVGGVSIFTQNATGTSEVEEDRWHPVHDRAVFNHAQYQQMEWAGRLLADGVIENVNNIRAQRPTADVRPSLYGGTPYSERFVPWMSDFPVAMEDRWFGGPVSHPYPGVSSCRTDAALSGDPRVPIVGLPDCTEVPAGSTARPIFEQAGVEFPGLTTDDFEQLGIPIPENYSAPSSSGLEDTLGVHMQAFRLGDILFTVCSCEQWADQAFNIKTRTDTVPGNEWLGYDPTSPNADSALKCVPNDDGTHSDDGSGTGTWTCTLRDDPSPAHTETISDRVAQHMRAQIRNDAAGWDDPTCNELGCGPMAESEPTDLQKIRGNYTHDDTDVRGGTIQAPDFARDHGYTITATISMANDYNGYIATYRDFMSHDHYRKALTGWGPHSSDYYATRLTRMGHALKGDEESQAKIDGETEPQKADPAWAPVIAKEAADQQAEEAKVRSVGEAAAAGVQAYDATLPDDGAGDAPIVTQPKDIERFDAATFTWVGGNNYTDDPVVRVERKVGDGWETFADQSGEVPVTVAYPGGKAGLDENAPASVAGGVLGYRAGGQVWQWTATFEAFVSQFPLVDPQGRAYQATPAGTYRFVVDGEWRQGGADAAYERVSDPFEVTPWSGLAAADAKLDPEGHVSFAAGPASTVEEQTVRSTARPPLAAGNAAIPFTIGPVDFPDMAAEPAATGADFLSSTRGYSGTSLDNIEHYCLDCSFRPWLDATGAVTARVEIARLKGAPKRETLKPDASGRFVSRNALRMGDVARITLEDAWGNRSAEPVVVSR
ncbi:MAG: hypothetical protein ACJ74X_00775 [Gaiellaceae bacterium]